MIQFEIQGGRPTNGVEGLMQRLVSNVDKTEDEAKRMAAFAAMRSLHRDTPVDTGYARGSWTVTIGAPGTDGGVPEAPSREALRDRARQRRNGGRIGAIVQGNPMAAFVALKPGSAVGQPVFVSNRRKYIRPLNDGWSRQAPAGFVERAVDEGMRAVDPQRLAKVLKGEEA